MNATDLPVNPSPEREEALFQAAAQLETAAARAAFLDQACAGQPTLRGRIEALLAAHDRPDSFLDDSPGEGRGAPPVTQGNKAIKAEKSAATIRLTLPPEQKPGEKIGRYKIRETIGEGGCGIVYVAEQEEPVRRRVALKVIKLGMDTRSVMARFEAERQALAMMDHPNIAKVLDAGATETGRPYFVMELVRGIKITDYCDQNKLTPQERLDLFIQVCNAIQHAHQKGIIHRDIKPSNILVTLHDGVPVPKVIDFGIAKATEGRLTDLTVYTELHQFIGTPAYMSPEQAEMSGLDIDTRSDIYSLGVLLYELLTGRTPFDANELMRAGLDEIRRTIREVEPIRPSTRLSTMLNADLTILARLHGAEPPKLVHLIRGDLDWIVMKCLEKDRTRRFETANGLVMDIQRFLNNEPVVARPPSNLYRFQKLVRRNKAAFIGVGAVAAALVLGLGLSLYLFVREREAHQNELVAKKEQERLRQQAEAGLAAEAKLRESAEIGKKYAEAGMMLAQRQFDEAERLVNQVPSHHPAAATIFSVLGLVHGGREHWNAAITNYEKVIALVPDDPSAYHYLAPLFVQTGDLEKYRRHCDEILRRFGGTTNPVIAERSAKDCLILPPPASDLASLVHLADVAVAAGPGQKPFPYFQFAKSLAEYRQGHFGNAMEWAQKVIAQSGDMYRTVQADAVLAMAQYQLKQTNEARATLTSGLAIVNERFPKSGKGYLDDLWNDWIVANTLMKEAQALIEGASKTSAETK